MTIERWEYLHGSIYGLIQEELNCYGADGWELAWLSEERGIPSHYSFVMKRKIVDDGRVSRRPLPTRPTVAVETRKRGTVEIAR